MPNWSSSTSHYFGSINSKHGLSESAGSPSIERWDSAPSFHALYRLIVKSGIDFGGAVTVDTDIGPGLLNADARGLEAVQPDREKADLGEDSQDHE